MIERGGTDRIIYVRNTDSCMYSRRYMFGLAAVPSAIQFVGFLFMPESPRWLAGRGRLQQARAVLSSVHGSAVAENELEVMTHQISQADLDSSTVGTLTAKLFVVYMTEFGVAENFGAKRSLCIGHLSRIRAHLIFFFLHTVFGTC